MRAAAHRADDSAAPKDLLLTRLLAHRSEFLGFLAARVGDRSEAEDILQAAYTRALEKGEQIKNAESVTAWFYRLLRNGLVDHYRRDDARTRAHEHFAAEAPSSYETELEANLCTCVGGVIQTLKPEYRTVLERIDLGNESIAQFAQAAGTSPNNTSVRLHRARRAAAKRLIQVCGVCAEHKCLDCTCKRRV
jgi:RNA polymerase sigma factor (sigma-70 family)